MSRTTDHLEWVSLGKLIDAGAVTAVSGFPCGEHNGDGQGILQIRPFNVTTQASITLDQQKHIPSEVARGKPSLSDGDILFNNTNTKELVGKTALWRGPPGSVFSNHMTRLRVGDANIPPQYLAHVIHAHWITGRSQMLARPHVAQASILGERFREITVPWPCAKTQAAFAKIFNALADSLAGEHQAIATARDLKRAAMRVLFTRGLRGEAQKETEIGPMPDSWSPTPVVQLGAVKGGKRMPKGVSLVQGDTGRPYIRVTDFKDHSVRNEGILFVPHGYEDGIRRYRISTGDVYISIAGSIGLVGQVPAHLDDANLTENAAKIVFQNDNVLARYVMFALAGEACQSQITRATAKNAQPKLALTRIEQVLVPLPPTLDEQREVVAILDAIDRKIALHGRKRAVLDELFKALLHKLMTGELRVADLDLAALAPPAPPAPAASAA
jgi:type I restriction enzyme S subunit